MHVQQWAAGVARTDRAIGLQRALVEPDDAPQPHHQRSPRVKAPGMAQGEHPVSGPCLREITHCRMGPGAAVGDPHEPGVAVAIPAQGLAACCFAIGKGEAHGAIRLAADVPGSQHEAIGRDYHTAAAAVADLYRHHCGRHARDQGLDVPLHGSELGYGGWGVPHEGGGQVRAASGSGFGHCRNCEGVRVGSRIIGPNPD